MLKYVDFDKVDGNLRLTLTQAGIYAVDENPDMDFWELIEWQLCNGWERIRPEEIGALTDSDIITDDVSRDDTTNEIVSIGRVYWHPNYQVENPVDTLRETGNFVMKGYK